MLKTLPVSLSEKYFQNTCWITYCCQLLVITERLVNLEHLSVSINNNHTSEKAYWLWYYQSGLPRWFSGKESTYQAGDWGSIAGLGRSLGEGNGNPLQYSCLGNSMDWGSWQATVHGVAKSQTRLGDWTTTGKDLIAYYEYF